MYDWMNHMWDFWGMGWGMWFWMLLLSGISYLFYLSLLPRSPERLRQDPLEIARIRLARGEITLEEYENVKRTLRNRS